MSKVRNFADTGYAGTGNRDYCKENGIQTSYVKRGRPFSEEKKEKDLVRKELARVRATALSLEQMLSLRIVSRQAQSLPDVRQRLLNRLILKNNSYLCSDIIM